MKRLKLLLLLPLLFVGCADLKEGSCPPTSNMRINFSLIDSDGKEVLPAKIDDVEFFLFDQSGVEVKHIVVSKSNLALFPGVKLLVDPGVYTVVGWANLNNPAQQMTTTPGANYLNQSDYFVTQYISNTRATSSNGSPLYYLPKGDAPMTVTVPATGAVEVIATMRHAHVNLQIEVVGYTGGGVLDVEISDIIPNYSFDLTPFGTLTNYIKPADANYLVSFYVPLFQRTTAMQIKVTDNFGALITPAINIADLIPAAINIEEVVHIPVTITFGSGGMQVDVSVNLPGWDEESVTGQ